jgi:hypothetical protein
LSSIKCSVCGQRILHPGGLSGCPNCGAPLAPQLAAPETYTSFSEDDVYADAAIDSDNTPPASSINDSDTSPLAAVMPGSQFPKGFPQRPPELEGSIMLVAAQEEPKRTNGAADTVFNTLLDILWAIPGGSSSSQSKEKERVYVITLRVRSADDVQKDIRLEGRLTGVNVAQGDRVSLWGKDRRGLLIFQRGYNHTTNGSITTTKTQSARNGLWLFAVALAGIVVLYFYYTSNHIPLWPH